MRRILYGLVVLLSVLWAADTAWAECRVLSANPTYTAGQLKDLTCGTNGALAVGGGVGSATAAAPTFVEGSAGSFSFDLSGNARVTLGTLLSGENQANNLLMTSGGLVRVFTIMTGVTTNTTSATAVVHSGGKTPMASLTGTGALTGTVTFYGDMENTTTAGEWICTLVLDATTKGVKYCNQFTKDYSYYHAVTTLITGTGATVAAQINVGAIGIKDIEFKPMVPVVADTLVQTGPGFLQCILISENDAAPTAGTIDILDSLTAAAGTKIFSWNVTTAVFTPLQICPQVPFTVGLYIDFTTTNDVNVSVSRR